MTEDSLAARLESLRNYLSRSKLDGIIVPRTDAHQSEATAAHDGCLQYINGFTGSAGFALVLGEKALIFVDGRYQVQVRNEVDMTAFDVHHEIDDPLDRWLQGHAKKGWRIAIDPMRINCALHDKLAAALATADGELVKLEGDPFDELWLGPPDKPLGHIRVMPVALSGETSKSKRQRIAKRVSEAGADMLVETLPDNIAWLLNVRGSDVPMNPGPHSFLVLNADGGAEWFVDRRKLGNDLGEYELDGVSIAEPERFLGRVVEAARGRPVLIDPAFTPEAVRARIVESGGRLVALPNPITAVKATKNSTELDGYRACHFEDGVALTNFLAWVTAEGRVRQATANPLMELEAEARLTAFRAERPGFLEPSFRPISAAGANAAMCHYRSQPKTNAPIGGSNPYLIDSGGQYLNGTTDVTRTLMLGEPSAEVKSTYTAVLKGFLSLLMVRFPTGTQGHQLDAFARRALWDIGLDFDHTTGHGVGHNLLIHEQPHQFSKEANPYPLEPGNFMTIEPGYYRDGAFGLRIENQVEVVADGPGFCRFSSLTLAPIDLAMADLSALTAQEIACLDEYHTQVRSALKPLVLPETLLYLIEHTRPVTGR